MKRNRIFIFIILLLLATATIFVFAKKYNPVDSRFITYTVHPKQQDLQLYWKDDKNELFKSIQNLKTWLGKNKRKLVFATNAGMYKADNSPQGLYIEKGYVLSPLDTSHGDGNFYLEPNGVFYLTTNNTPVVCKTESFRNSANIKYATQSGPMLVIDGKIHPAFKQGSANLNIRSGVGILPGNKVLFAMSKEEINFYDFAEYFKSMGCKNALYLDGLVSRTYLPEKQWVQSDGNFGVIFAVTIEASEQ